MTPTVQFPEMAALTMMAHCAQKDARRRLMLTAEYPYRFKNVIKNPKPMQIITCTSWKPAKDKPYWKQNINENLFIKDQNSC